MMYLAMINWESCCIVWALWLCVVEPSMVKDESYFRDNSANRSESAY